MVWFYFKNNKYDRKDNLTELVIYKSSCDNNYVFTKRGMWLGNRNFLSTKPNLNQIHFSAISLSGQSKTLTGTWVVGLLGGRSQTDSVAGLYLLFIFGA